MRPMRHAIVDDPVQALAAGVWAAAFGFATGFFGYLVFIPS